MLVIHLTTSHEWYESIMERLAAEPLASEWYADAESRVEDGVAYLMALARDAGGVLVPAAWAGYRVEDRAGITVLKCCNNYVSRPFRGRTPDPYAAAYRARHAQVVTRLGLPAETYLFPEPVPRHVADGWVRDTGPGGSGISTVTGVLHCWQRLTWTPPGASRNPGRNS